MPATRYRLGRETRAVECENGAKGFVLVPEGALLTVDSVDATGRLAKVLWGSQVLLMFWQDLVERGVKVEDRATARVASPSP